MDMSEFIRTWGPIFTVVVCSAATALLTIQSNEDQLKFFEKSTEENFKRVGVMLDRNSAALLDLSVRLEEGQKQVALQDLKLSYISGRIEDYRSDMEKEDHLLWSLARENQANIKSIERVLADRAGRLKGEEGD